MTPDTHWIGGWLGPSAGLDTEATGKILLSLPGIKPQLPSCPVLAARGTILTELLWLPTLVLADANLKKKCAAYIRIDTVLDDRAIEKIKMQ
jgi:hypothetical protein